MTACLPAGVVFDLDGTLVDTETVSEQVLVDGMAALGHEVTPRDVREVRGRAWPWMVEWFPRRFGVSAQAWSAVAKPMWDEAMRAGIPTLRDGMAVLHELADAGVPLALCTSSGRDQCDLVLATVGIADVFVGTVTASDVANHKPDPEPYRRAVALLGTATERTVAIEDTVTGATAARAAGLQVVTRPAPDVDTSNVAHRQVRRLTLGVIAEAVADVA